MPPKQREALMLIAAAGFSYEEAAAIVGCAIGTIISRAHHARCKLMMPEPLKVWLHTSVVMARLP
jgi:RNA polymerase sigma-70 factor, ECF subfamily